MRLIQTIWFAGETFRTLFKTGHDCCVTPKLLPGFFQKIVCQVFFAESVWTLAEWEWRACNCLWAIASRPTWSSTLSLIVTYVDSMGIYPLGSFPPLPLRFDSRSDLLVSLPWPSPWKPNHCEIHILTAPKSPRGQKITHITSPGETHSKDSTLSSDSGKIHVRPHTDTLNFHSNDCTLRLSLQASWQDFHQTRGAPMLCPGLQNCASRHLEKGMVRQEDKTSPRI